MTRDTSHSSSPGCKAGPLARDLSRLALLLSECQHPEAILDEAMPIYEYRCEQGHMFEVMQRMSDAPVSSCETCSAPVERVFRPVAVHFKGSGFYNTDYGTRKRSRELKESAEGGSKKSTSEDGGSAKTDSGSDKGAKAETAASSKSSKSSTSD